MDWIIFLFGIKLTPQNMIEMTHTNGKKWKKVLNENTFNKKKSTTYVFYGKEKILTFFFNLNGKMK